MKLLITNIVQNPDNPELRTFTIALDAGKGVKRQQKTYDIEVLGDFDFRMAKQHIKQDLIARKVITKSISELEKPEKIKEIK